MAGRSFDPKAQKEELETPTLPLVTFFCRSYSTFIIWFWKGSFCHHRFGKCFKVRRCLWWWPQTSAVGGAMPVSSLWLPPLWRFPVCSSFCSNLAKDAFINVCSGGSRVRHSKQWCDEYASSPRQNHRWKCVFHKNLIWSMIIMIFTSPIAIIASWSSW